MDNLISIILFVLLAYMVYRTIVLGKRSKKNQAMLKILDQMDDEEVFYKAADDYIASEPDVEFKAKVGVLRLFADALYDRDEDFKEHLEELNITDLLKDQGRTKGFDLNEDSFVYLCQFIPGRLWYRNRFDLVDLLKAKLDTSADKLEHTMVMAMWKAEEQFYKKEGDRGRAFAQSLQDGTYEGYVYSKQLIGIYKNMMLAVLTRLNREEGREEDVQNAAEELGRFSESRLGKRWLTEWGLEDMIAKSEEEEGSEEKTEEDKPAEEEEAAEAEPAESAVTPAEEKPTAETEPIVQETAPAEEKKDAE